MKKQFKKSLSLFLAVLMMLSCWVWVAPEKAKAGTATPYYVKIVSKVTDTGNEDGSTLTITYKDTNGTGSTGTKVINFGQMSWDGDSTIFSGTIDGWPTSFTWKWDLGGGRAEKHENITFYVGGSESSCNTQLWKDTYNFKNALVGTDYLNLSATLSTSYNPKFSEVSDMTATDVAVSKLKDGAAVTSTVKVTGGKDQYGVSWAGSLPTSGYSYKLKYTNAQGNEADLTSTYGSISGSSNSATATFNDDVQTLFPNAASGKVFAHVTYNSKTKSVPINLTFPTYDITFDANGGKIGASDSDAKDQVVTTGIKYGGIIGKSPVHRSKAGFVFDSFYSVKNSDATGLTASFTGTKYVDSETTVGTQGDMTYYAAWKAAPITATFMTADNQLIGTVEGRYNNYLTAENMYGDDGLNAAVKASHTAGKVNFNGNVPVYTDGNQAYTFAGWKIIEADDESLIDGNEDTVLKGDVTFQAVYTKADATKYTVSFEDGAGNVTASKNDYYYRAQVTGVPSSVIKTKDDRYTYSFIGWAKKLEGVKFFAVDENDCDKDGIKIVYTSKDSAEFIVKGNATYVPVFRMIDRLYSVTYEYYVDGGTTESTVIEGYKWEENPVMPEIKNNYTADGYRYTIEGWTVGTGTDKKKLEDIVIKGDTTLTAVYGEGIPAEYEINFYGKAEDGETDVLIKEGIYEHNSTVEAPEVAQTIDTEDSLYTFAGWSPSVITTATGDVDYYATYTKKDYADLYFYNYDGTLIYSLDGKESKFFVGETIPKFSNIVDGVNVLPTKEADVVGTYNFTGWKDGSGNDVVPGTTKFSGDTHLTAQFETVYTEYTVKFLNDVIGEDGKNVVVSEKKYHYGDSIEIPANPTKAKDDTYKYEFKAWSPDVSEVCYGDATYTATYRREHNYYYVTWYTGAKDKDGKLTKVSTNGYTYGAKIQQAVINEPENAGNPKPGYYWALKHWVQCDENGNLIYDKENHDLIIFARGDTMPAENLYFYPVFEEVAAKYTVTFENENGDEIGKASVSAGDNINDYVGNLTEKLIKLPTDDYHYVVDQWIDVETEDVVLYVRKDVTVKPVYKDVEHTYGDPEVDTAPTCTEIGYVNMPCTDPNCGYSKNRVVQDIISDDSKPEGQIYVGSDLWKSVDFDGMDYSIVNFFNSKTTLIVNAEDTGARSIPWNTEGKINRGVSKIEYYVSEIGSNGIINDPSLVIASDWTEIYNRELVKAEILDSVLSEKGMSFDAYNRLNDSVAGSREKTAIDAEVAAIQAAYKANVTGLASNLKVEGKDKALENGKEYIIYIKVSDVDPDADGAKYRSNVCYFSSGKLHYGTTAPEIAVSGNGYGTKLCAEATVTVTDDTDGVKAYLDGVEVTLTDSKFTCNTKGVHTVTAVDQNGNKATKTFEIKGGHTFRYYSIGASCMNDGAAYDLCILCGEKTNEKVIAALGHSFTTNYTEKEPTCVVDGYRTYVCDNNCGEKKIEYPEDFKATGEHTYAKVKDEDGNDTDVDAWVIDKDPTCKVPGSKHKDCIKCGLAEARVTEEIPADTENGHKFYREKVTSEPLCQEIGKKTKTCRYCGYEETTAYIDALGHVAGEYVILTAPTCTEKGKAMLTCSVCDSYIGEGVYDPMKEPVAKELPVLGHAWKLDGEIYQAKETDEEKGIEEGKWYQNYVCRNDATHTDIKEVPGYQPPVAAIVTFNFNGGYYEIPAVGNENEIGYVPPMLKGTQTISAYAGEFIAVDEVEKAFKLDNATKTYTFSHWEDEDGKEVKFPVEVKGDATYYAVYAEKYVNYTITYYKEDGMTEYKKTGYLHNGKEETLSSGPSKAGDWQYTYKFAGWKVIGGETVYTDTVTIDGANINLVATYEKITNKYAVTYAYSSSNTLESFLVDAGTPARECGIVPTKNYDTKYHYEFSNWNKTKELASVQSNIYTTPDYEAIKHSFTETTKSEATCTANKVITKTCACGYSFDVEVADSTLEHIWGESVYNEETGKNVVTCERENCGVSEEDTRTFTAKFFVNDQLIKTVPYINWGTTIAATRLPADPSKASTATTDYTFKGWAIKKTTDIVKDYEFVAVFEEIVRVYTVVFAYEGKKPIKVITGVKAGESVTYTGDAPAKDYDANHHYIFSGWKGYEGNTITNVQSDLYITAEFNKVAHVYTEITLSEATCTNGKGTRYKCTCGYFYDITGKALGHAFGDAYKDEATGNYFADCTRVGCDATEARPAPSDDNGGNNSGTTKVYKLTIRVLENGNTKAPIANAQVDIYKDGIRVGTDKTGPDGTIAFEVEAGKYDVDVSGIPYQSFYRDSVNVSKDTTFDANVSVKECSCACHETGFWGSIFRFFHKIIKLFAGEFKCCKDPSDLY